PDDTRREDRLGLRQAGGSQFDSNARSKGGGAWGSLDPQAPWPYLTDARLPRQWLVARSSPLDLLQRPTAGAQDVPHPGARAVDGEVGLAVAVVVAGNGLVAERPPLDLLQRPSAGTQDVPRPGARPVDGEVGLAVAVVVAGDGNIAGRSPLDLLLGAVTGVQDVPRARRGPVDAEGGCHTADRDGMRG